MNKLKTIAKLIRRNRALIARVLVSLIVAGLIISMGLLAKSHLKLQEDLIKTNDSVSSLKKDNKSLEESIKEKESSVSELKNQVASKDKDLKKSKEENKELEQKIKNLNSDIQALKSAYGGYGGEVKVNNAVYTPGNSYTQGYCTWGVKQMKGNVPNFWGHASQWDDAARASGIAVDGNPRVGSVAQSDAGGYGHVAMVISVDGRSVTIKEMNGPEGFGVYGVRTVDSAAFKYIHI